MTPEELEAERLRLQEEASTSLMMQPTNLMGQQASQEDINPLSLAGLGGAAAFQGMFPFAGEAAANSRGTTLPQLMGAGNSQFTGANAGRLTPGTQIVPQTQLVPSGQPPAVRPMGGPPAVPGAQVVPSAGNQGNPMKMAQKVGQPGLPGSGDTLKPGMGSLQKFASGLLKGGLIGALATPNTVADTTLGGAFDSRVAAGEDPNAVRESLGLASDYGNVLQELSGSELELANQYAADYAANNAAEQAGSESLGLFSTGGYFNFPTGQPRQAGLETVASPPQNINTEFTGGAQMSRLGDEPLVFNAPTGPSSTATQAAQIAATLPDDAGLMGAPGVQGTGIPTTTLDIDGGSATVPQALADQTFQGIGSAPMSIEETRARLGGMTLNQYLNAPDGTEGVYGLRTDPQGRMIPAGAPGTSQTRADAYGQYEDEVSQAYQRQSEQMQQRADQRDGTAGPRTYGDYTTSQLRGMVGGGDNLRAAQMRAEAGLNPVTGNREKTEAERSQSEQQGQLQNEVLQARLDSFKQTDPDKLSKAQAYAERLGLTGDSATAFIFSQMGTSMDDIFGLEGTGTGGGGGSFTEAQQSSISKVMAANPGSSREQIIAEMKKQGKL